MYHSISENYYDDPMKLFTINPNEFESHIKLLNAMKEYRFLDLSKIERLKNFDNYYISITFDDGFSNVLDIAAPILCNAGIPFSVFVVKDYIFNNKKNYLTEIELKELSKLKNVTIGSHGSSHLRLEKLSDKEISNELFYSKTYIEDLIGKPVKLISYPHGSFDHRAISIAESLGYKFGFTSNPTVNKNMNKPLELNRSVILSHDNKKILKQKIKGSWDWQSLFN